MVVDQVEYLPDMAGLDSQTAHLVMNRNIPGSGIFIFRHRSNRTLKRPNANNDYDRQEGIWKLARRSRISRHGVYDSTFWVLRISSLLFGFRRHHFCFGFHVMTELKKI